MDDAYNLNTGQVFGELMKGDLTARIAAYRDPEWRARAASQSGEFSHEARGGRLSRSPSRPCFPSSKGGT